ncbi:MAG: ATP-binding protein [Syntrophales bacterium]|jgi:two-component system sensor histidine kinase PilS (NtrC family)|nr:ATP-binding protein [Syntrophales bacterium]
MKNYLWSRVEGTSSEWDEYSASRLHWLVVARMGILFFLLMLAFLMETRISEPLPPHSMRLFYGLIIFSFALSLSYFFLIRFIRNLTFHAYLQALFDIILVTGLIYVTGGLRSIYSVFYPLAIIYSVVFLGRQGGFVVASLASISYGVFVNLEFHGLITPLQWQHEAVTPDASLKYGGNVFFRVVLHILSFYLITLLASFVVVQEKRTRKLLREKEHAFAQLDSLHRSIIESVQTGILTVDLRGRIRSFNRAAEEITGFLTRDVLGKPIEDVIAEYGTIVSESENINDNEGGRHRVEIVMQNRQNHPLILGCSLSPLKGDDERPIGYILIFQDITKIKEMERAYEESRKMAYIGEMAAILAHEIRNPLASISGSIQVLKNSPNLSGMDERLLRIMLRGKDQLEKFIKDFLALSRPTVGVPEQIHVAAMVDEILESIKLGPFWHEGIEIEKTHPPEMTLTANRTELHQLLWNLLLNAIQAMPDGGRVSIDLAVEQKPDNPHCLKVRVADQGVGIEEQDMKKIFQPFFTTKDQGTGLGLAIVNRIVVVHGGELKVDSVPGQGTLFTLDLPVSG